MIFAAGSQIAAPVCEAAQMHTTCCSDAYGFEFDTYNSADRCEKYNRHGACITSGCEKGPDQVPPDLKKFKPGDSLSCTRYVDVRKSPSIVHCDSLGLGGQKKQKDCIEKSIEQIRMKWASLQMFKIIDALVRNKTPTNDADADRLESPSSAP